MLDQRVAFRYAQAQPAQSIESGIFSIAPSVAEAMDGLSFARSGGRPTLSAVGSRRRCIRLFYFVKNNFPI